jgi:hypothetical protein
LFAGALAALADFAKGECGDLVGRLAALVDAAQGGGLPGGRDLALPFRQIDAAQRRAVAINTIRTKGRLTSGELAKVTLCADETARLCLRDLALKGVLRRVGRKRAAHYLPGDLFPRAG